MADANLPPIIVVKRIKKGDHGHHGGAWKVAYADFVTAMMAFFLLLWLLNATTEEQKRGISNYFAPASVSRTVSGGGGVLGGQSMSAEGSMPFMGGAPSVMLAMPPSPSSDAEERDESTAAAARDDDEAERVEHLAELTRAALEGMQRGEAASSGTDTEAREQAKAAAAAERQRLAQAAEELRQAIQQAPELQELAASMIIDQTDEGLRIQLVDQERLAMFPLGSAQISEQARALLGKVAQIVAKMPEKLAISGHTDATPFRADHGYGNWELSSDRANASRRALLDLGVAPDRIVRVIGKASTDLLVPSDPSSPRNRRIGITLLRESLLPPG